MVNERQMSTRSISGVTGDELLIESNALCPMNTTEVDAVVIRRQKRDGAPTQASPDVHDLDGPWYNHLQPPAATTHDQ